MSHFLHKFGNQRVASQREPEFMLFLGIKKITICIFCVVIPGHDGNILFRELTPGNEFVQKEGKHPFEFSFKSPAIFGKHDS